MNSYQESEDHIAEAKTFLRAGDIYNARKHFLAAARLQQQFVEHLPIDRLRTRSVYGLSAATLYYRANELDAAEKLASSLLASDHLETRSREQLRDLLAKIWLEQRFREPIPIRTAPDDAQGDERYVGILRAVDLDSNTMRLDMYEGKKDFKKAPDLMDDVVAPLLNKRVQITGHTQKGRKTFVAYDIEPALSVNE